MRIKVIDVSEPESKGVAPRRYQEVAVTYRDDADRTTSKKLLSFNHPDVFRYFTTEAKKNDVVDVVSQKDDKGYWQWIAIGGADGATPEPEPEKAKPTYPPTTRNTYETPEERAIKQRSIVRQWSVSASLEHAPKAALEDVLKIAQVLEDWVYRPFPVKEEVEVS